MNSQVDLESTLAEALVRLYENQLEDYDWAWHDLRALCEEDPIRGYDCVAKAAESPYPRVAAALGAGILEELIENSAAQILDRLLEDAEKSENLRYALSSAMAFSHLTGNEERDEQLNNFYKRWNLRDYYERLCNDSNFGTTTRDQIHESKLGEVVLHFYTEPRGESQRIRFAAKYDDCADISETAGKIRILGQIELNELINWRSELWKLYENVGGIHRFKLGANTCLGVFIEVKKTGLTVIRVNFWIDNFLMPQMMDLDLDQTYLGQFINDLDLVIAAAGS
jgi:hypothetical protein